MDYINVPPGFPPLQALPVFVMPPLTVMMSPISNYGISYDFYMKMIQKELPNGWHTHRGKPPLVECKQRLIKTIIASVYKTVCDYMRALGYVHAQYSVWHALDVASLMVFHHMIAYRQLWPSGIIPSVLRRLQMYHLPNVVDFVHDVRMILGGVACPGPLSPTPARLCQTFQLGLVGNVNPPNGYPFNTDANLPHGVRRTATSRNPVNWRLP